MKIHSDTLTEQDTRDAVLYARRHGQDIFMDDCQVGGSRRRKHGITFYCGSLGGRYARSGREGRAASWDAYGWVLTYLFNLDPGMTCDYYLSAHDFADKCQAEVERITKWRPADLKRGRSGDFLSALTS